MSFCSDIKSDIYKSAYKNSCCRRALLCSMLYAKGDAKDGVTTVTVSDKSAVLCIEGLVREFYSVTPESVSSGGRRYLLNIRSKAMSSMINKFAGGQLSIREFIKCPSCQSAILRGLFMAAGKMSDPTKQFCLELTPTFRQNEVKELLDALGLEFLVSTRARYDDIQKTIFCKRQAVIEDFFSMAALENVTYDLINSGIQKDFNNRINRLRNIEIGNIARTVEMSKQQRELIQRLIEEKLLSSLPDELAYTARMRLENPDASLAMLASFHTPPITKSGLSHRLNKIMTLGGQLLEKHKK